MKLRYLLPVLAVAMLAESASAMRCGTHLISEGDHQFKVQKLCGEPASVQLRTLYRAGFPSSRYRYSNHPFQRQDNLSKEELLFHDRSVVEVQVEEWIYNFGPNRFVQHILFENGVVVDINRQGYGY